MVTEQNNLVKNTETAVKEEKLRRLQKKQKELLVKLKAKKQKLASLESNIESYRLTVFSAVTEARNKILKLQEELRMQFQALRKAKLLTSLEKKKLRELEMEIMPAIEEPSAAKDHARHSQKKANASGEEGETFSDGAYEENVPQKSEDRQLRKVYLRLATIIHPDKASSSSQASIMHELMQRVNAAYKAGDIAALLEMEQKYATLLQQDKDVQLGSVDYLQRLIEQVEQEVMLLQTQFDKVKLALANVEKSDLGRMYKEYTKLKKYYKDPVMLITGELHETIEYLVKLKNSVHQFLETGIMPSWLEEELYDEEENWEAEMGAIFDLSFEDEESATAKKQKSARKS